MNLNALILRDVFLMLQMVQKYPRAVPPADLLSYNRAKILLHQLSQNHRIATRTFHVVLPQLGELTPEQVDLQSWTIEAPHDAGESHQE